MKMNPDEIKLENLSKIFEYERISREIDSCENIELLKNISKSYVKLYFKQQETVASMSIDL
jgi:hypothetical protein